MTGSANAASPPQPRAAERILKTARELFYKEGIRAVGVDTIASEAGVTKPTLYRCFNSKDELAAAYVRVYDAEFWARFEGAGVGFENDPRTHLRNYLTGLGERATLAGYRGCGLSNAAVEYPEEDNPARMVAEGGKVLLRERLEGMAERMGARNPGLLADGLLLLIEGAFVSGQIFHEGGPAGSVAVIADLLIEASLKD
ncbi:MULTISPECIES: TetR/AcrR family transcriptional regulator [Labrys]|jgi:AcrR family transcriptional regulator|uniref:TetR/AcrR family transcriptional regulator n=1 Tax=Labrys TaxID=204476 RepID=UPI00082F79C8|nr:MULTISPECIES: TetR/AcrR family transcriptional regulator [unclassified Labrys (in: a-proteobacteria)]MDZ5449769.1 TetR/AcrR family transcriptional regulator [Labrys sp. ZIDIC5]OCC04875.1 TetR family transcriptional regulator [Labrys sp. WJW]